ncbi:MAG TPA: glycosyltransferase [Bacteroidales bacterium]|nr:glycosyltransferase [Bacteroidales bacterium]
MNKYPRILIFGPPFNNFTGGGITLSNLFKGWDKESIAVASTGHVLQNLTTDVCDTYYLLGKNEQRWMFPFNFLQRPFPSGLMTFEKNETLPEYHFRPSIRRFIVNKLFYPFLKWIGLIHIMSKIRFSEEFRQWLTGFNPEILYMQVTSKEDINFAVKLCDFLRIPSVIHNMDDWPSTISNKGLFKTYWKNRIDREFKELLARVDLHLSISHAMSDEYLRRYNINFTAFHNPIETKVWKKYTKTTYNFDDEVVKVLYSGRIGVGITESLVEVATVIEEINKTWGNIKLFIQSPSGDFEVRNRLQKYDCIVLNSPVEYSELPAIFSTADIMLIANDFEDQGIDYLRYSMPTKVSEYMISGTPILVYASPETAVSKFFMEHNCGSCVTEQDPGQINEALKKLVDDREYREKLGQNAVNLALNLFDSNKVRHDFQTLIIDLTR